MSNGNEDSSNQLRITFVEMLFALAVAEIAVQAGTLALQGEAALDSKYLPSISHLLLSAIIVAASWIGWLSSAAGKRQKLPGIFTWAFVVLFLDVVLVVFYFIVVKGVDFASVEGASSAMNETFWVMAIFFVYLLWDILTKFVSVEDRATLLERLQEKGRWRRPLITLACVGLAWLVYALNRNATNLQAVLLTDAALLCVVLVFRSLKEHDTARVLGDATLLTRSRNWSIVLVVLFAATSAGGRYWHVISQQ